MGNTRTINAFNYLKTANQYAIYDVMAKAMKYFDSDPEQSCINFRTAFTFTIREAERMTCCVTPGKLGKKLATLCRYLKDRGLVDKKMRKLLFVTKDLADKYHHPEDNPNLDPVSDREKFYGYFHVIFKWFLALPHKFAEFVHNRTLEKEKLAAEEARLKKEAAERAEAEKKAEEERKKAEKAEQRRQERNAKAREKRKQAKIEREEAARVRREEEKKAQKEAQKQLKKIRWQERVEKYKKYLPWVGYGALTIVAGVGLGLTVAAIRESTKKDDYSFNPADALPDVNPEVEQ